ncbi:hypothetical protein BPAE_0020g00500 [Botrytis paeoniae]|uniref:Dihydroneopterin aldolase/epimerase domain-containing protein n=1 Tax=Botrytis paeoniae TaxID=278948 RepID=A0A4Z1FWW1_9HELO|nr:hypothetical protein BPAE_0020g00500 [Botrytis paeoniae]
MESQADLINTSTILSEDHSSVLNMAYNSNPAAWMSSWELSKAREEPVAVIAVRDMQLQVQTGPDGWGGDWNETNCPYQPALVSVSVSLRRPFRKSSEEDDIAGDTIHYGLIKIAIIDAVQDYHSRRIKPAFASELSMKSICIFIASYLTTRNIAVGKNVNWSSIRIMLPKSSLRGAGASLTAQTIYKEPSPEEHEAGGPSLGFTGECCTLRLHDLTVPTIIGLLPKERTMKQNVVANIEIDRWSGHGDLHWDMQQIVVKTIEESSFQTLEALAERISKNIIRHSLIPTMTKQAFTKDKWDELADDYIDVPWEETHVLRLCPIVKIKLEKPSIYIDTTPGVEMSMDIRPLCDSPYFNLWEGYKRLHLCPRPLKCTLTDWIAQEYPEELKDGTSSNLVGINRKLDGLQPDLARTPQGTKGITAQPGEQPENPKDGQSPRLDLNQKLDGSQTDTSKYNDIAEETVALPKEHPETPKDRESPILRDVDRKLKTLQRNIAQLRKTTQDVMATAKELDDRKSSMLVEIGQKLDAFKNELADAQKVMQEIVVR